MTQKMSDQLEEKDEIILEALAFLITVCTTTHGNFDAAASLLSRIRELLDYGVLMGE